MTNEEENLLGIGHWGLVILNRACIAPFMRPRYSAFSGDAFYKTFRRQW
jgi:hypothetical protein